MKNLVLICSLLALTALASESGRNRQWSFATSDMIDDLESELLDNLDSSLYLREMCDFTQIPDRAWRYFSKLAKRAYESFSKMVEQEEELSDKKARKYFNKGIRDSYASYNLISEYLNDECRDSDAQNFELLGFTRYMSYFSNFARRNSWRRFARFFGDDLFFYELAEDDLFDHAQDIIDGYEDENFSEFLGG